MDREIFEFFPKVSASYKYDEDKHEYIKSNVNNIINQIKSTDEIYHENKIDRTLNHYYNNHNLNLFSENEELFSEFTTWLKQCALDFMVDILGYEIDSEILITDSWINKAQERSFQIKHNHSNCIVSGTYYVNFEDLVHSPLKFFKNNSDLFPRIDQKKNFNNSNKYNSGEYYLPTKEGYLFLWSSELYHGYEGETNLWADRTTISMNFMPKIINNGKYSFTII
jgi:uncharacterized protein (TIGR02466 family)